eukprot:jgi/Hompol1/2988/HPOL_003087-RA
MARDAGSIYDKTLLDPQFEQYSMATVDAASTLAALQSQCLTGVPFMYPTCTTPSFSKASALDHNETLLPPPQINAIDSNSNVNMSSLSDLQSFPKQPDDPMLFTANPEIWDMMTDADQAVDYEQFSKYLKDGKSSA